MNILEKLKMRLEEPDHHEEDYEVSYSDLLGINRAFDFKLHKTTIVTDEDLKDVSLEAMGLLKQDLERFGIEFVEIEPRLKRIVMGELGCIRITASETNSVIINFYKRDKNGIWSNGKKNLPLIPGTVKHFELIFSLEQDDED